MAADAADAPAPSGATFTLTVDGQPQPLAAATLGKADQKGTFVFSFETVPEQPTTVVFGSGQARLTVGRYAIYDTTRSDVIITADLPARFDKECALAKDAGFGSVLGLPHSSPIAFVHDRGAGTQELRGRKLGQFAFTRVSEASADGAFESYVYCSSSMSSITYQSRTRGFVQHKGHLLRGTFKNLPYADAAKALNDLQNAIKAVPGVR